MSQEPTIPNIIRHIAETVLKSGEPMQVPIYVIVANMMGEDAPGQFTDEMTEAVKAVKKKMTGSYICMTVNRMKSVQAVNKSASVRFFTDVQTSNEMLELGLKEGNTTRDRGAIHADRTQYKRGYHDGLSVGISFVPDFVDYTPEQFEIAQSIVKQYRAHLEVVKETAK